jgi:hypothetical protein
MASDQSRLNGTSRPELKPGRSDVPGAARATMNPGDEAPAGTPGTGEDVCPVCSGKGRLASGRPCENCGGTGKVIEGIGGA